MSQDPASPRSAPLRVLLVEDSAADAELMLAALERAGLACSCVRVETEADYLAHLDASLDVILADYTLPGFDALRAARLLRERGVDVPLLIVSGTIGEELAVAALKSGVSDYVLKHHLIALGPAVQRALELRRLRAEQRKAEAALRENERRYRVLAELTSDYSWSLLIDERGQPQREWVSAAFTRLTGYTPEEMDAPGAVARLIHRDDRPVVARHMQRLLRGVPHVAEYRIVRRSGEVRWLRSHAQPTWDPVRQRVARIYGAAQDVTETRLAQAALARSERHFRSLIESALDMVAILDADAVFRYASPAFEHVLGYPCEDLLGRCGFDYVHPDDLPELRIRFDQGLLRSGGAIHTSYRVLHRDGSWRWCEAVARNLLDDPDVAGVILSARDVTGRSEAEQARRDEAQVTAALARLGRELIASADTPGVVERLCAVVAESLGCPASQTFLWHEDEEAYAAIAEYGLSAEAAEAARVLPIRGAAAVALRERLRRDDIAWLAVDDGLDPAQAPLAAQLGFGACLYMGLWHGDELIGFQSALLHESRPKPTTVEERIARGVSQLASMAIESARLAEEVRAASRVKSEFIATMSHELRTPLNVILGYAALLLEGDFGTLNPEQADALQRLDQSSRALLELVTSTLDLGRLHKGIVRVQQREVRVADLLRELEADTRELREKPGLEFVWRTEAELPALLTDPAKLGLALKNLIHNAVKFTEEGRVAVDAHAADGSIEISVIDTGIGIAPDVLPIIFEPFRQGDPSLTRRHGGAGLGLYVTRQLLDLLGGRIAVESEPGRGSTFRVWLPAFASAPPTVGPGEGS